MMMKTHKVGMVFSRLKRAFICKIVSYTCIALSESNIKFDDQSKIIIIISVIGRLLLPIDLPMDIQLARLEAACIHHETAVSTRSSIPLVDGRPTLPSTLCVYNITRINYSFLY